MPLVLLRATRLHVNPLRDDPGSSKLITVVHSDACTAAPITINERLRIVGEILFMSRLRTAWTLRADGIRENTGEISDGAGNRSDQTGICASISQPSSINSVD